MAKVKANAERRDARVQAAALRRPHVILGNRPGDHDKWAQCDLSKILVTEQVIESSPLPVDAPSSDGTPSAPSYTNFGIDGKDKERLFRTLPSLTVEGKVVDVASHNLETAMKAAEEIETRKTAVFASLVDLRNANAGGIAFENRRRVVAAFSPPGRPDDTGRPEVQSAFLRSSCLAT